MIAPRALKVRNFSLDLPIFLPDATNGFVRSLISADLSEVGIQAVMMNAFHLMQKPGSSVIAALGGLHRMSAWDNLIMTDSGGFQAYSLIHQNPKFGSLSENGITFHPEGSKRKLLLSPEKSIQLQLGYGSDVLFCLDDCTHVNASYADQKLSVERTVAWCKRGKKIFQDQMENRKIESSQRSLLFAVIQGGGIPELRKQCAEQLLELGFDGFGFGGWPLDEDSNLLTDILAYTREVVPVEFPIHALGIGHPLSVVKCYAIGYEMFDCALPTRDARHGRLYARTSATAMPSLNQDWFTFKYINSDLNIRADAPISPECDCPCCSHYSLGYLYHLFRMGDGSYARLATQHNLRFMTNLMANLRRSNAQVR